MVGLPLPPRDRIVLILNEGDLPRIDAGDAAFMQRMVIAPFRSRFVPEEDTEALAEEFTFAMAKDIDKRFDDWLPALADLFLELFNPDALDSLPQAMTEWRQGVVAGGNVVAGWLQDNVEVTGDHSDAVTVKQLKDAYVSQTFATVGGDFTRLVKAYFTSLGLAQGVRWADATTLDDKRVRGVVRGVKVASPE